MLTDLLERGRHLTCAEITALISTDPGLWRIVAGQIDSRLRSRRLAYTVVIVGLAVVRFKKPAA